MKTRQATVPTPGHASAQPPTQQAPRGGLERAASCTLARAWSGPSSDPGAIEYASWLRLLHRPAP